MTLEVDQSQTLEGVQVIVKRATAADTQAVANELQNRVHGERASPPVMPFDGDDETELHEAGVKALESCPPVTAHRQDVPAHPRPELGGACLGVRLKTSQRLVTGLLRRNAHY